MRKLILTALMAAVAVPAATVSTTASAQAYRDGRDYRDGREHRGERYDRRGGRDDWRGYRERNGGIYARGNWRAPFRYQGFRAGSRIGAPYYARSYWISDPYRYRLPAVRGYQRWVRHYNDVLLVDTRRGRVIQVHRGFYR